MASTRDVHTVAEEIDDLCVLIAEYVVDPHVDVRPDRDAAQDVLETERRHVQGERVVAAKLRFKLFHYNVLFHLGNPVSGAATWTAK